jgi:hypothetical protein
MAKPVMTLAARKLVYPGAAAASRPPAVIRMLATKKVGFRPSLSVRNPNRRPPSV